VRARQMVLLVGAESSRLTHRRNAASGGGFEPNLASATVVDSRSRPWDNVALAKERSCETISQVASDIHSFEISARDT
jgi:hypothetical protein